MKLVLEKLRYTVYKNNRLNYFVTSVYFDIYQAQNERASFVLFITLIIRADCF